MKTYTVNLGTLPVEDKRRQIVTIRSPLLEFKTNLLIVRDDKSHDLDNVFNLSFIKTERRKYPKIAINFNPQSTPRNYLEYFSVHEQAKSKCLVKLVVQAETEGPLVEILPLYIDLGTVSTNKSVKATLSFINHSKISAAYFHVHTDNEYSLFTFSAVSGKVPPDSTKKVSVSFESHLLGCFARKYAIAIHNQGFYILTVTCIVYNMTCLEIFEKAKAERKKMSAPPSLMDDKTSGGETSSECPLRKVLSVPDPEWKSTDSLFGLHNCSTPNPLGYSMSPKYLSFERCEVKQQYTKTISFLTDDKRGFVVIWPNKGRHFFTKPSTCSVGKNSSANFEIIFKPNLEDHFYSADLECYIYLESMTTPVAFETVHTIGHSFKSQMETRVPNCSVFPTCPSFTPCTPGSVTHGTIRIAREEVNPVLFEVIPNKNSLYSVSPLLGALKHSYFVLKVTFRPTVEGTRYYDVLQEIRLNCNPEHHHSLRITFSSELPTLLFEHEGQVMFPKTRIHSKSSILSRVRNICRFPVSYKMMIPPDCHVTVEPSKHTLMPNAQIQHVWSCVPDIEGEFNFPIEGKMKLSKGAKTFFIELRRSFPIPFTLNMKGCGCYGGLSTTEDDILLLNCRAFSLTERSVEVFNTGESHLNVLFIPEVLEDETVGQAPGQHARVDNIDDKLATLGILMDPEIVCIPASKSIKIVMKIYPRCFGFKKWMVYYSILKGHQDANTVLEDKVPLFKVFLHSHISTLCITNCSMVNKELKVSRKRLSLLLNLNILNYILTSIPPVHHKMLTMQLPPAPVGSCQFIATIEFSNPLLLPVHWRIERGRHEAVERVRLRTATLILTNLNHVCSGDPLILFNVTPTSGVLGPMESFELKIKYRHICAQVHIFPIKLVLAEAREVNISIIGVTITENCGFLQLVGPNNYFHSVCISDYHPPIQTFHMYNHGQKNVGYSIDTTKLDRLKESNYGYPIIKCLDPKGAIPSQSYFGARFVFSPIEEKDYSVTLDIKSDDGSTTKITFKGTGTKTTQSSFEKWMGTNLLLRNTQSKNQQIVLSSDQFNYGIVPAGATTSQILFLTNPSSEDHITFKWKLLNSDGLGTHCFNVLPCSKRLRPLETVACRLRFTPFGIPEFIEAEVVCEITSMTSELKYQLQLMNWEAQKEKLDTDVILTDLKIRYEKSHAPPAVPKPVVFVVSVIAQVVQTEYYSDNFPPSTMMKYFLMPSFMLEAYQTHGRTARRDTDSESSDEARRPLDHKRKSYVSKASMSLVSQNILSGMIDREQGDSETVYLDIPLENTRLIFQKVIKCLLEDKTFYNRAKATQDESVPYFTQLRSQKSTPKSSKCMHVCFEQSGGSSRWTPMREEPLKTTGNDESETHCDKKSSISDLEVLEKTIKCQKICEIITREVFDDIFHSIIDEAFQKRKFTSR